MQKNSASREWPALIALFSGALAIGGAALLVRLSETGPTATAFWRGALALPLLAIWAALERPAELPPRAGPHASPRVAGAMLSSLRDPRFFWGGVCFAGDLALWNWSLLLTSIAASTLEANLAPIFVPLIAWLGWGERPAGRFLIAIGLALGGMLLIVSPKLGAGGHGLLGDALGVLTACFYASYILVVARLRGRYGTGIVMFNTTLVFTLLLLPLALTQKFFPSTPSGWAVLAGCALAAQFLGQGLIAYALAHLPPTFSAVALYLQPIGAAVCAWLVLHERLSLIQIAGGCVVMSAIAVARSSQRRTASVPQPRTQGA